MVVDAMVKARTQLLLRQPFFGALALRLKLQECTSIETMDVDGTTLRYNPTFVASLSIADVITIVAHEVCHCMLLHHLRRNSRCPTKWNIAGDLIINKMLKESGFNEPSVGWLYEESIGDTTTDHVYTMLPDMPSINIESGAGGIGEVLDSPTAATEADFTTEENDWKVAVVQSANAAKAAGKLPANLERLIETLVDSKVCWKTVLREFVKSTSNEDYSWSRPNRRFIGQGMYFPSMYSESIGELVVAVDTSASVSQEELNQFASEISAIMEDASPSMVHVVYCDTEIANTETFTKDDMPLKLNAKGGGGTDFRPPFAWVDEQGIQPACFIYLTDMGCYSYPQPPDYPVLWIDTSGRGSAPFGEMVEMVL